MASILDEIKAYKLDEIRALKERGAIARLERGACDASPVRPFREALEAMAASGRPALIAEIKRASPSKGLIRADFDVAVLARAYEGGGAACLSVLTDGPSFQGAGAFVEAARSVTSLPVLRKDFLFDPVQVVEARALGADCILIILAAVSDAEARALEDAARDQGMDALLEVHDEAELDRALALASPLVGINNRDLHTFETRLETTERLAPLVPADRLVVAESGIATPAHIARLAAAGARAFLVGESLMREADVEAATRALLRPPAERRR